MKLKEVLPQYREYWQSLVDKKNKLTQQRDEANKKIETTGDKKWSDEAATLQLSIEDTEKECDKNQKVLDGLVEQYTNAINAEVARQQKDATKEIADDYAKIMTTIARMCKGDIVPASDERKVMDYDKKVYAMAKQMQQAMAMQKKKREKHDSLWDDDEKPQSYDPKGVAENTEVQGSLPEIPAESVSVDETAGVIHLPDNSVQLLLSIVFSKAERTIIIHFPCSECILC